jgi:hypothetical protein
MALFACDRETKARIIAKRRRTGVDRFDEVWNGVYVMSPLANNEHQDIGTGLSSVICFVIAFAGLGRVFNGCNVSDRQTRWKRNYRCPDVAVFLNGKPAIDCGSHWFGGPDFGVEIVSKGDRSRKKFGFYAKVGTRELLIADRYPWALELYVLKGQQFELAGRSKVDDPQTLQCTVLPLRFRLIAGDARPQIEVTRSDGSEQWLV